MPQQSSSPARGIILLLAAVLTFATMDVLGKITMTRYNVPLVMALRYGINLLLIVAFFAPSQRGALLRPTRPVLVLLRGASLAISSLFAGMAFQRMPVAESTAIFYLSPIGVLLLARPFLGERVGLIGWIAAMMGFLGVILVSRPGSGLNPAGVSYALICAALSTAYALLSRLLAKTETTSVMLFYTSVLGLLFFAVLLPWQSATRQPDGFDFLLIGSIGVLSFLGHYFFTQAYRYATASSLAPVNYMHLVFAGLYGWLIFDHVPDFVSLLGMGLIALAGLFIAFRASSQPDPALSEPPGDT